MTDAYAGPRRWPWVLLGLAFLLLILLFGGHWMWSGSSARRLSAEVARIRAAGEPIEPGDFIIMGVPDEDNAAIDLRRAARNINTTTKAWTAYEKLDVEPPLTDKEIAAIDAAVAENAAAFADVDNAMTKKGVDWKIAIKSPVIFTLLPDLHEQRQLANLLRHRAMVAHQRGDHAAALADIKRIEFIAMALEAQPWLISAQVGLGTRNLAALSAEALSPTLKIGGEKGAASPEQVRAMIATLLDDKPIRLAMERGLMGERMAQLDVARNIANGTLSLSNVGGGPGGPVPPGMVALGIALKPMALDDGLIMIRHTTAGQKVLENSADVLAYKQNAPPSLPPEVMNNRWRHVLARMMLPSFDRAGHTMFKVMTQRHMSAVALAIRLYQLDHDGAMPAKLEDLVPRYLPAVPADAMSSGSPLKLAAATTQPVIYSVGENNVDDGGSELPMRPGMTDYSKWQAMDAVTHLTPQPRKPPKVEGAEDSSILSGVDAEGLGLTTTRPAPATTESATTQAVTP